MAFGMEQRRSAPQRVQAALSAAGVAARIEEFPASTRTAQDAAAAVGTGVGQIVKSLLFLAGAAPVLALVSGANQLDPARLAALTGASIGKADADAVRQATGYSIGGVPPTGSPRRSPPSSTATSCSTTSSGPRRAPLAMSFRSRRKSWCELLAGAWRT
jgi:prolyl-tRNA editing enzyme YbaK/EbsC (Cys-tRNA(Pro) deacylase)